MTPTCCDFPFHVVRDLDIVFLGRYSDARDARIQLGTNLGPRKSMNNFANNKNNLSVTGRSDLSYT